MSQGVELLRFFNLPWTILYQATEESLEEVMLDSPDKRFIQRPTTIA